MANRPDLGGWREELLSYSHIGGVARKGKYRYTNVAAGGVPIGVWRLCVLTVPWCVVTTEGQHVLLRVSVATRPSSRTKGRGD